jgi:hypothetical protein
MADYKKALLSGAFILGTASWVLHPGYCQNQGGKSIRLPAEKPLTFNILWPVVRPFSPFGGVVIVA